MTRKAPMAQIALALVLLAQPAAAAKPKGCFTNREHQAEQVIRHGIFLRESARLCAARPYYMDTDETWKSIEEALGASFAADTARRAKAFDREFGDRGEELRVYWNGRLVMEARHSATSPSFCDDVKVVLDEINRRGMRALKTQAEKARNLVLRDYKNCGN